ncbi:MAG: hypothetical protein R3F61_18570 [Myxococcota bacterium]
MWFLALAGCANPISNELFNADEEFLSVLPSQQRIGFVGPFANITLQPEDDPVLVEAFDIAEDLDALLTLVTTVADVLRSTEPSERSDTHRTWSPRSMATPEGAPADLWWIRATIARSARGADFTWSIDGATSADGPWTVLGSGRHDPDGLGTLHWDYAAAGELLAVDLPAEMDVDYDETAADRDVQISIQPADIALPMQFAFAGRSVFGWTGDFALTEDGATWPGAARVLLLDDHSGRGEGVLQRPDGEVAFATCWNATGLQVWSEGGADIPVVGVPADCPVPDLFDLSE